MKFIILILVIHLASASFYTDGTTQIDVEKVIRSKAIYSKSFVDDRKHAFTSEEIETHKYHFECVDNRGNSCSECQPFGSDLCMGARDSLTYSTLYGDDSNSDCVCVLMKHDTIPTYIIQTNDGVEHRWDSFNLVHTEHAAPQHSSPLNCSVITKEYLRHKCFVEEDPTYKTNNYNALLNTTYTLLGINKDLWKVNIDRSNGEIIIYYDNLNELFTFPNKLNYEIAFSDTYKFTFHNETDIIKFEIPNEAFWRNVSLTWSIKTNDHWIYGEIPLANGTFQWYAHTRPDDEILIDECTRVCGAFCFRDYHCMTTKQQYIKVAEFFTFGLTILIGLLSLCFIFWDQRRKEKRSGTGTKFKRTLMCLAVISLSIPQADAWGTCTATAFTQSKLKKHQDGIDSVVWSGNMFLSNIKGQSCFDITDPEDPDNIRIRAILEVEKAEVVHQLTPQYSTYSFDTRQRADEKCPIVLCSTIHCDGLCKGDRTCDGKIAVNTDYPGRSSCSDELPLSGCADSYVPFSCSRRRKIVGYHLEPQDWYIVSKINSDPQLRVHVKVTLDYINGTQKTNKHTIVSTSPDMNAPAFTIGGTEFYNNGISQTNTNPEREYVMIHVENSDTSKQHPISTDVAYLVDANPVGTKVSGNIGAIQCRTNERDNCDAPDDICSIDFSATSNEVKCGIDPVLTATYTRDTKMPLSIDGVTYKLSQDLTTLSAELSNIGSISLFMNGESELQSETVNVVPECSIIGQANGCYMCTTGFWVKMKAKSSVDSGKARVSIRHADSSNNKDLGIFTQIVALTTTDQEIDIHGFTEHEDNDLIVTLTAGQNSCEFPVKFKGHFEDKTAIANRSKVYIDSTDEAEEDFGEDVENIVDDVGSFFSNIFGGMWSWFRWILIILVIGLILCFCGPCLGPLLTSVFEGFVGIISSVFKGATKGVYQAVKKE